MCALSYVHVFRIEYVSYRQGPYRIRIVLAADRIVPALFKTHSTALDIFRAVPHILVLLSFTNKVILYVNFVQIHCL